MPRLRGDVSLDGFGAVHRQRPFKNGRGSSIASSVPGRHRRCAPSRRR
jgi:hypothetical protein